MAIYDLAKLAKEQLQLDTAKNAHELRFTSPEVHLLFLRQGASVIQKYLEARTSEDRVIDVNYFLRSQRAAGTARIHNHTGAVGNSGVLIPAWTTTEDKFATTLKQANNKIYTQEQINNNELWNALINVTEANEAKAAAVLFAGRSGVNASSSDGTFDAVDDTFEITESTNGESPMQITKMMMRINGYKGHYTVVCDPISFRKFETQSNQGSANSTNTMFQYQGITFVLDITLSASAVGLVSAYNKGYWIVVPDDSIMGIPWIPLQNRLGVDAKVATYGSLANPIDNIQIGVHSYEVSADGSSKGGQTQDIVFETSIDVDVAYEIVPQSVGTPLFGVAFV